MPKRDRDAPLDPRPRAARAQPVPRPQPAGRLAARLRRPGDRPGAGRRGAHRRGPRRPFAPRLFHAARRPGGADHLRGRPHPRRQELHHPPRRRHPARRGDLLHVGLLPGRRRRASTTRSRCPKVPPPEELPSEAELKAAYLHNAPEAVRRYWERAAADRAPPGRPPPLRQPRAARAAPARLGARHRHAARRSRHPPLRPRLRLRHDAARHLALRPRPRRSSTTTCRSASLDHAMWFHRPVPRRRVAALRRGQPVGLRRPRLHPRQPVQPRRPAGRLGGAGRPDPRPARAAAKSGKSLI